MIFKIAITGGTSSGKSYIAKILSEKLNCLYFDADKMVNEIYSDSNFCKLHFLTKYSFLLNENFCISKEKLKKTIIGHPSFLNEICLIVYPEIKNRIIQTFQEFSKEKNIIFEITMLFESEMNKYFDFIIHINSNNNLQLQRSIDKKIDLSLHQIFVERQMDNQIKNQKSNFIIYNNENLLNQINECVNLIINSY
jgi:dephospho-CoA kinase